jgi:putative ABC transport system permease protein
MIVAVSGASPTMRGTRLPMIKLAHRNLLRARCSLIITLVGIVFSAVRLAVQDGICLGSKSRITTFGPKSFDGPALLPGREKHAILSTPGVAGMKELTMCFLACRKLSGIARAALLGGSDTRDARSLPRDINEGGIPAPSSPNDVAFDLLHFEELGTLKGDERAEIKNMLVTAQAAAQDIQFLRVLPYASTTLGPRQLLDATPKTSAELTPVAPGYKLKRVHNALQVRLRVAAGIAHRYRKLSLEHWLFEAGAGATFIAAAAWGVTSAIVKVTSIDPAVVFSR